MAIGDDFAVDLTNKRIYHSANNDVYTAQALYSWLMDTFDELNYMDDDIPMTAQTPTEFTLVNGWILDNGDGSEALKYLKGGSIKSSGYSNDVLILSLDATTDCISSDIGKVVTDDAANVGELLAYKNDYPVANEAKWWIRDSYTHGAIADNSTMAITSGTGAGTAKGGSATGDELHANIYTLGSIESTPSPQIYVFQNDERIAEWSDKTSFDRGHIDVLITVKEAGTEIDNGVVTVFARQSGDLFDHYEIDLSDGGRNAVPISTYNDLNNTDGEYYLLYDGETGGGFSAGNVVTDVASGVPTFYAEIVSVTDWGTSGLLTLRGVRGTVSDNDALYVSGTQRGNANGTLGDTYCTYSAESVQLTVGLTCTGGTSGAKRILRGIQDDGTTGKYVFQVDTTVTGSNRDAYYKSFSSGETITDTGSGSVTCGSDSTTVVSGFDDITVAHINGTATHGGTTGTFTPGERVTYTAGEAIVVKDTGSVITLANVTNTSLNGKTITGDLSSAQCTASQDLQDDDDETFAFQQQSAYPYNVFVEGGSIYNTGRTVEDIYQYLKHICRDGSDKTLYLQTGSGISQVEGQEYIIPVTGHIPSIHAPFGVFAGGKLFGAQGVWIEGMTGTDQNNVQLTDENGSVRTPYASVTVKVTNTVNGDRVAVFRDSGSGEIDKDTFTSHASNNSQSDSTFEIQEDIPTDTPTSGIIIVVATDENQEHRYRYTSWSGKIFTLMTERTGSGTSGSSGNTLVDSSATFQTWGVKYGDIIRNTTDSTWGYVVTIDSETQITTVTGFGSSSLSWDVSDNYELGSLVQNYDGSDTVYCPYIHDKATTTSIEKTILYVSDRDVIVKVRNVDASPPILEFRTTEQITSSGMSVTTVRNPDNVYT